MHNYFFYIEAILNSARILAWSLATTRINWSNHQLLLIKIIIVFIGKNISQSIRNKTADFVDYVCENKFDLLAVTETWLKATDDSIRAQLCPTGYKFLDKPRKNCRGCGTALLYRDSIKTSMTNSGQKESFEFSEWVISLSSSNNTGLIIYRPPSSENHRVRSSVFFKEFLHYTESIILSKEHLLILGDFNIHVDVLSDPDTRKFLDLLYSLGLEQHVDQPTHIHGHTLDLAITSKASSIIQTSPRVDRYFSDHGSVVHVCNLKLRKPTYKVKTISYRKLKSVDMDRFNDDLASSSLCTVNYSGVHSPASFEKFVKNYESTLSNLIDHPAPIKTKTVWSRPQVPWYNRLRCPVHRIDWDSAECVIYSTDYYQRLTLESWFTNLEQTPLNRCQQLPAPYKRLINDTKTDKQ